MLSIFYSKYCRDGTTLIQIYAETSIYITLHSLLNQKRKNKQKHTHTHTMCIANYSTFLKQIDDLKKQERQIKKEKTKKDRVLL